MDLKIEHFPFFSILGDILNLLAIPFINIIETTGRLSWIYLLSSLLLAMLLTLASLLETRSLSGKEFLIRIQNFSNWNHPSSRTDYIYYFIETILHTIFFSYFVITTLSVAIYTYQVMYFFLGDYHLKENIFIKLVYTLMFLCAYDGSRFLIHKGMHKYPLLWEFHKFHHSAEVLNPFTVYRIHPVESILLNSFGGICTGIVTGIFVFFYPTISMYSFLGVNFGLFLFHLYSNLRHTHVWLNFPVWLSYILLSPAQHQIHHSKAILHQNLNLGAIFSIWDLANHTLYIPKKYERLEFGLPEETNLKDYTNIVRIFFIPFRNAGKILLAWKTRNQSE